MKRFAALLLGACICTALVVTFLGTAASPSWSLDERVSVSREPIAVTCHEKCDHKGQGGVCISTANNWMCAINQGSCNTLMECIGVQ
jgi:hypothetical protein